MSDAANLISAAARLRNAVPYMGEEAVAPAVQVLQALAAWQQSFFRGVHAVHAETQTNLTGRKREKTSTPHEEKRVRLQPCVAQTPQNARAFFDRRGPM